MNLKNLNFLTQDDANHRTLVDELQQLLSQIKITVEYIKVKNVGGIQKENPVLTVLEDKVALLDLNFLPFPLPKHLFVHHIIKSKSKSNIFYALVSNSATAEFPKEIELLDQKDSFGKVYLVGAGQGNYKHLTLRAKELLEKADIIFYDSLIDQHTLELSKAEKIFVGKRANKHYKDQKDINQLIFEAALQYKTVVRLKGGDPMIFGHAGEEIAYLQARQITVETIPGISSPIGAAAIANLPLTLRNVSNSVSFCSAHEKSKIQVPNTDTIVYFMGANNLSYIAGALKNNGKSGSFPITLFYNIGASDQEIYNETIDSILKSDIEYKTPLLIIAGEVGDRSLWYKSFTHKPKILFTGTHIEKYSHLGYIYHQPMIALRELTDYNEVDQTIKELSNYNWILFTSPYAVKFFFKRFFEEGKDTRSLCGIQIASIGSVTTEHLNKYGIVPDIQAKVESSEGLCTLFEDLKIKNQRIIMPQSNLATDFLSNFLRDLGNEVKKITIYENYMPDISKKVEVENFDQVIFTSPSCVDNFIRTYSCLPQRPEIISRGKATQERIDSYLKNGLA